MNSSPNAVIRKVISEEVMVAVLNRCDETREFLIEMWINNPKLARQGGAKVAALIASMTPPTSSNHVSAPHP